MSELVNAGFSLIIFEALNIDEFEKEVDRHTDIVLMDADILLKERKRLGRVWKKIKSDCSFALLFSGHDEDVLEKVLHEMGKQNSLPSDIHILKDTYPDALLMRVLVRMIVRKSAEKNLAVL